MQFLDDIKQLQSEVQGLKETTHTIGQWLVILLDELGYETVEEETIVKPPYLRKIKKGKRS